MAAEDYIHGDEFDDNTWDKEEDDFPMIPPIPGQSLIKHGIGPCRITYDQEQGHLVVKSPYDKKFLDELHHTIPLSERRWDRQAKVWLVSPKYAAALCAAIQYAYNQTITINHLTQAGGAKPSTQTKRIKVEYLGAPRERKIGDIDEPIAWGHADYANLGAEYAFPLSVLMTFFGEDPDFSEYEVKGATSPGGAPQVVEFNPYKILGVPRLKWFSTPYDPDIKKMYRVAAKTFHPDVSKEPNAVEKIKEINLAAEVLSDPAKKARFDMALQIALKAQAEAQGVGYNQSSSYTSFFSHAKKAMARRGNEDYWLPPVRCGEVSVRGYMLIGRFIVEEILEWEQITRSGKTFVTYWDGFAVAREWI